MCMASFRAETQFLPLLVYNKRLEGPGGLNRVHYRRMDALQQAFPL